MTIPYKYSNIIIGIILILIIPIMIFFFKRNVISFISCTFLSFLISFFVIYKYGNTLHINGYNSDIVIKNIFFSKKNILKKNIRGIYIHSEHIFFKDTIYINFRIGTERKVIHLGTLSSKDMKLLYNYLNNNIDNPIEIITY
jgi:putative uncharacterized protein (fragment)